MDVIYSILKNFSFGMPNNKSDKKSKKKASQKKEKKTIPQNAKKNEI